MLAKALKRQITAFVIKVNFNILHLVAAVDVKCLGVVVLHIVSAGVVLRGRDAVVALVELGLCLEMYNDMSSVI